MMAMLRNNGRGVEDREPEEKARRGEYTEPARCDAGEAAARVVARRGAARSAEERKGAEAAAAAATALKARAGAATAAAEGAATTDRTDATLRTTRSIAGGEGKGAEGKSLGEMLRPAMVRWKQAE